MISDRGKGNLWFIYPALLLFFVSQPRFIGDVTRVPNKTSRFPNLVSVEFRFNESVMHLLNYKDNVEILRKAKILKGNETALDEDSCK